MMTTALMAALTLVTIPPERQCALSRLQFCSNTNLLFADKAFTPALRAFVGNARVRYLYPGRLSDQQIDVLGGPPDTPTRFGRLYRFTACRAHSCTEKGAIFMEPDARIVATAILHSDCDEPVHQDDLKCFDHNILTVFVASSVQAKPLVDNLSDWARAEIKATYVSPGDDPPQFSRIEVYSVHRGVKRRLYTVENPD